MSEINIVLAIITLIFGGGGLGALYSARASAKRFESQSETDARAGFTAEFEALAKEQSNRLNEMKSDMAALRTETRDEVARIRAETKAEVNQIRAEHRNAEDYIDVLIIGISDGSIPPIPHRAPLRLPPQPPVIPPSDPET